ncbi:MAG: hypothetical protein ABS904_00725 [Solibacillus isronensis]
MLGALIPPIIVISIIILVGNFFYKMNPQYMVQGKPHGQYELFELSIVADLENEKERPTDGDVCIAYFELDDAYYEYMDSLVFDEQVVDENGEPIGSDAPVEIMGQDVSGEHSEDDGHNHDFEYFYPEKSMKGDLCVSKNLVDFETGYEQSQVFIYDAIADPTKFLSLFSLGDKQDFYLVRTP